MPKKGLCSVLFALILFVPVGQALKCYYCPLSTSWESCKKKLEKMECSDHVLGCVKVYMRHKSLHDEQYGKGCALTCNEYSVPACRSSGDVHCDFNCCTTDFCNAGSSLTSSVPVMLVSAIGALAVIFVKTM